MPDIVKFIGNTGWTNANSFVEAEIERAILRSQNEIVIEFHDEDFKYTVTLQRSKGNEFSGGFTGTRGSTRVQGRANCKIMFSGRDALLVGTWDEEGESFQWWATLEKTDHFPDEKPRPKIK